MALRPGTHSVDPDGGRIEVRTYREGLAQKVGHDLIIDVAQWQATLGVGDDGAPSSIALEVDPRSLQVRDGLHGVKPLSDKDRGTIRREIDEKILGGQQIWFQSSQIERGDQRLTVRGELTMAGTTRPAEFDLQFSDDGQVKGTLPVAQSEWGIKPYRGFMGALKVRDQIEVVIDVRVPAG